MCRLERTVAITEQHGYVIVVRVQHQRVCFSIPIHISYKEPQRGHAAGAIELGELKGAVPVPQQHRHSAEVAIVRCETVVDENQIGFAVSIHVVHRNGSYPLACGVLLWCLERSVTIAQHALDPVVSIRQQVELSVAINVSHCQFAIAAGSVDLSRLERSVTVA